jgi:hypothetical protein
MLASLEDINLHLPSTVLQMDSATEDPYQIDAERIIRGYLSNVFSTATLTSWSTPSNTPQLIRSIAGRLIAAWFYASKVGGETPDWNDYSDQKYKEALDMLAQIRTGDLVLEEVTEELTIGDSITSADFWPNDLAPVFSMDQEFA